MTFFKIMICNYVNLPLVGGTGKRAGNFREDQFMLSITLIVLSFKNQYLKKAFCLFSSMLRGIANMYRNLDTAEKCKVHRKVAKIFFYTNLCKNYK